MNNMEKWLELAIEIQSLAQAGLTYTSNVYDIERYERLSRRKEYQRTNRDVL